MDHYFEMAGVREKTYSKLAKVINHNNSEAIWT